ncbi:MAG: agmatinase [Cyclobacteriaceae bacterium]|nr:agmatinase [Cyclobacteriaceae bacterium]
MIATLDIPFDSNSSFLKGPALAPSKIREAFHSDSANYFSENFIDLKSHSGVKDLGPLNFSENTHFSDVITSAVKEVLSNYDKILSLGGDHSITYPIIRGVASKYKDLTILHIDAHPDLYENFEGNRFSHASPFARIMEEGLATRLVQVGIRTMSQHQREQAEKYGVEVIHMKNFNPQHRFNFRGPVYVSLDIDAIDPAFAPGVSHHEPGGLSSREVISILQNLSPTVIGADLVEFNPIRDPSGITAMLAAKLYKELLDLLLRSEQ